MGHEGRKRFAHVFCMPEAPAGCGKWEMGNGRGRLSRHLS